MKLSNNIWVMCERVCIEGHSEDGLTIVQLQDVETSPVEFIVGGENTGIVQAVLDEVTTDEILEHIGIEYLAEDDKFREQFFEYDNREFKNKLLEEIIIPLINDCKRLKIDIGDINTDIDNGFVFHGGRLGITGKALDKSISEIRDLKFKLEEAILRGI